jgi:hypothetical protein
MVFYPGDRVDEYGDADLPREPVALPTAAKTRTARR